MANLSATLTAELNYLKEDLKWQRKQLEMSIIDPDYFKRHPQSEDEMDDEYSRFLHQVEENTRYKNFVDALEKELELKSLSIQKGKEKVKGEVICEEIYNNYYTDSYYVGSIEPLDSSLTSEPKKKPGDFTFNEICSMEMDSFHYWLQGASIEELEVFGKFAPQSKKRKHKRNIIQLLLDLLNHDYWDY
jgi:hypothetical protein